MVLLVKPSLGISLASVSWTIFCASFWSTSSFVLISLSILNWSFLIKILSALLLIRFAFSPESIIPTRNIFSSASFETFSIASRSFDSTSLARFLSEIVKSILVLRISSFSLLLREVLFCTSFMFSKNLSSRAKAFSSTEESMLYTGNTLSSKSFLTFSVFSSSIVVGYAKSYGA